MGATDLLIALALVAAAVSLLWRSLRREGGACGGCAGGCGRPAARREPGLVSLGGRPRR